MPELIFHRSFTTASQPDKLMRFLIIQTAFIGDVVLATPLVEQLKRFYPDSRIDFLLRKGNEALLRGHPHLNRVWIWDKKQAKYLGLLRLIRDIRRERYDWVINCQRFGASGLLTLFSGAVHTAGFDKNPFSLFFSRRLPHRYGTPAEPLHETQRNLSLISHLTDDSWIKPKLYPAADDEEKARKLAAGREYICMAPNSVWFTKQWPARKWIELCQKIPLETQVFLLGGPADRADCEAICIGSGRGAAIQNLAGALSFLESAALMKGARMNYVNDSAPIHIASAVDAPQTAIFCSTVPAFGFGPLSTLSIVRQSAALLDCRPCGLHGRRSCPRGHFLCATSIEAVP